MIRVGVTGGIGSGKTTLCRLFARRGAAVYDSDSEAKRLMEQDGALRAGIVAEFGPEAYADGKPDRRYLARIVFNDPERLKRLDALVHPAVRADFERWCASRHDDEYVILECALLFDAGFDEAVDRTVAVLAPRELRLERTCRRDGADRDEVLRRMAVQTDDEQLHRLADITVVNIREEELESVVEELDKRFRYEARHPSA